MNHIFKLVILSMFCWISLASQVYAEPNSQIKQSNIDLLTQIFQGNHKVFSDLNIKRSCSTTSCNFDSDCCGGASCDFGTCGGTFGCGFSDCSFDSDCCGGASCDFGTCGGTFGCSWSECNFDSDCCGDAECNSGRCGG